MVGAGFGFGGSQLPCYWIDRAAIRQKNATLEMIALVH